MDIINYIDQEFGTPNTLFPTHEKLAANSKYVQTFAKYTFPWCFYVMLLEQKDLQVRERCKEKLLEEIKRLQWHWQGPYYAGEDLSIGDIVMEPYFNRMVVLEFYRGFKVPKTEEFKI